MNELNAKTAERDPEIRVEMKRLDNAIDEALSGFHQLANRMTSVMRIEPEGPSKDGGAQVSARTEVGKNLLDCRSKIEALTAMLHRTAALVEL